MLLSSEASIPDPHAWAHQLATLYPHSHTVRRIARRVGLDLTEIDFNGAALDVWDAVVDKSIREGLDERLRAYSQPDHGYDVLLEAARRTSPAKSPP